MNVDYLIQLLGNKLNVLNTAKDQAFASGDLERINLIETEVLDVQDTLSKLRLLPGITQAASASGVSEAAVVASGIESAVSGVIAATENQAAAAVLAEEGAVIGAESIQPVVEEVAPSEPAPEEITSEETHSSKEAILLN